MHCYLKIAMVGVASFLTLNAEAARTRSLEDWIAREKEIALSKVLENISYAGTYPGTVIASPSRQDPDYFYHWIRDAALTMDYLVKLYGIKHPESPRIKQELLNYIALSRKQQTSNAITGLGEPKFLVDGTPFNGSWGRPQNDGPALRALTLTRFAHLLIAEGQTTFVKKYLFDSRYPTNSVIKADLEYVSNHWQDSNFDLWEEVKGHHFYTRMVMRRALVEGAGLALRLGDTGAGRWYLSQADAIGSEMNRFENSQGVVIATLNASDGPWDKTSHLDTAIILAVLHAQGEDHFYHFSNRAILRTAIVLKDQFENLYSINGKGPSLGFLAGRYPEDRYFGGNPWYLTSLAFVEYYYRLAMAQPYGKKELPTAADAILTHLMNLTPENGGMAEQIDRHSGVPRSARDLTWSYVSFLTAIQAREEYLGRAR